LNAIKACNPQDATTNPSLIYKAANVPEYSHLIDDAVTYALTFKQSNDPNSSVIDIAMDR
jgi:transaldolase